jgi:hypothetical protein
MDREINLNKNMFIQTTELHSPLSLCGLNWFIITTRNKAAFNCLEVILLHTHTLTSLINSFSKLRHTILSHDYLSHVKTDIEPYNHTNNTEENIWTNKEEWTVKN